MGNKPGLLIIGVQKSGTTFLHNLLSEHPELTGCRHKEIRFFNVESNYQKGYRWYEAYFRGVGTRIFFESTPGYIYNKEALLRIKEYNPLIKLIVILREPVARAYSAWNMFRIFFDSRRIPKALKEWNNGSIYNKFFKGRQTFAPFEEWIDFEMNILESSEKEPSLLRRGLYYQQIKNVYSIFAKENLLVLGYREVVNMGDSLNRKIMSFLDLKEAIPEINSRFTKKFINKRTYTSSISDSTQYFLNEFYAMPNNQLMGLLGFHPDW
jgi:hypothetical protein